MSLLDQGTDDVIVYPEEVVIDKDGNTRTRPSKVGVPARARIQVLGQSGTSSRRQEQDNEGYETEKVYTIRFDRESDRRLGRLGAQSTVEWDGRIWALFGDENVYNSSPRTAHRTYTIKRY
ncbi:head-to-tail stopper [Mycobacterium phage Bonamassa]|uniref:Head-to-tail stopper n=3 Tax=Benedictvirus TaxID=2946819 RepID=A0A076YJK1_9CAUD|nr:head closure Hc1 [Mycobacterium phage LittleCherry]YP_009208901.1 head closure Hc1 [Mycobacterium phage Swirley]YP_009638103.1 head closure Hc1 [Mycobacterium phage Cuco]AVR76602.1 head-to-tail stopper [Mycobacterium phage Coog]AVR77147.1 head-to-tail stopper [Mycobacterium phage Midas2]AXC33838.1 head-to-tail stopper [Mycobacterium phage Tarynearal]QAX92692.1 head-to-tail stopper [Mycobacterium phage HuhtaEnerson15]UJQ86255.1 head-to-tail stopper [Mycobacterium phage Bonamassa]WNM66848.